MGYGSLRGRARRAGLHCATITVVGLLVTIVGCADDSGTSLPETLSTTNAEPATPVDSVHSTTSASPTSTGPTSTSAGIDDPPKAILEAHKGFWDTVFDANDPPNPSHPGVDRYFTGIAREHVIAQIERNKESAIILRLPDPTETSHTIIAIEQESPDTWVLTDCSFDDGLKISAASGEVLDARTGTFLWRATVRLVDGVWKVSENQLVNEWEEKSQCKEDE